MSVGSPTAFLLWAILACMFQIFLCHHLWSYDKFQCIRWNSGRQPGAFKRVMTYSYLVTVPLILVFGVATAYLKFKEGFIQMPDGTIIPRPSALWSPAHARWVLPLYFVFSIAWALEIVTHLEELTFWLFLLHQGRRQRQWFHSWEFRTWYIGSMIAVLGMPLTTTVTRNDPDLCLANLFLVGSSASILTTISFLYILSKFPCFIRQVKSGGAERDVVIRLATFYQLNLVRVAFRFMFTVPLLVLAVDGVRNGQHLVVRDPFWSDFLLMIGGIGCVVSSAITLLIFFPRSMTRESGYEANANERRPTNSKKPVEAAAMHPSKRAVIHDHISHTDGTSTAFRHEDTSPEPTPEYESEYTMSRPMSAPTLVHGGTSQDTTTWNAQIAMHEPPATFPYPDAAYSYRRQLKAVTAVSISERSKSPELGLYRPPSGSYLHPYVTNFTSPIDLPYENDDGFAHAN